MTPTDADHRLDPATATMTAAVWTAANQIDIQQLPVPDLPPGWALIRSEYTGLCGTDFSILHGSHMRAVAPLVMGHEITGIVEIAADGGPPVGTRVTVEPLISCGHCWPCRHDASHVCRNLRLYGIDLPGSLAEYVALPASALVAVRADVPVLEVALAEPLAVAVHAISQSQLRGGETVLVFGAGPIGVLTALVARQAGAARVLVSEPSPDRLAVAASLGFEALSSDTDPVEAVKAATDGDGADIVFDTAAHPSVAAVLSAAARVKGTIVLVGVYKKPAPVDLQALTFAEQRVVGVRVYTRADVERAVELIEADELGLGRIPVQVFPLEDTAAAFDLATAAGKVLKVLVAPTSTVGAGDGAR
jgi:(R,R)-butanediol dehydrogenase/meso-butanediol dehydrogenase/diacetyl reductase